METNQGAKILTLETLSALRLELPESWKKAAGLLRRKSKALTAHLTKVRREWERK